MLRLIEKGLMFGGLIEIATPSLVARYNRALLALSGRQTKLESFHIDISGFAPEIGDELDDDLYLNCLLYTSPSPRDLSTSRMPSSA